MDKGYVVFPLDFFMLTYLCTCIIELNSDVLNYIPHKCQTLYANPRLFTSYLLNFYVFLKPVLLNYNY